MNATEFLQRSAETLTKRGETYDKEGGERSMPAAVTAFNAITRKRITEAEGWLLLQLIKDVRLFTGAYHEDSALDCVGYAALKGEAAARGYLEYPEEEGPIARKIRRAMEKHRGPTTEVDAGVIKIIYGGEVSAAQKACAMAIVEAWANQAAESVAERPIAREQSHADQIRKYGFSTCAGGGVDCTPVLSPSYCYSCGKDAHGNLYCADCEAQRGV